MRGRWGRRRTLAAALTLAVAAGLGRWGWTWAQAGRLRAEADRAVVATDWPRAAGLLEDYLRLRPDDLAAIRARVEIAQHLGDRDAALRWLARVPDDAPGAASAALTRGLLLRDASRLRESEAALREAIRRAPNAVEPRRALVALLGVQRRAAEQEEALWGLHRAGAEVEALRLLGQSSVVIPPGTIPKTTDEGAVLRLALEKDPDAPHVRAALARFHRIRGETAEALGLLRPWLADHPEDPPTRLEWLACLLDEGDLDAPSAWFDPIRPGWDRLADYRRLRADWLGLLGRHAEALADDRAAAALAPRDPEACYRLARGLRDAGIATEADEALVRHKAMQDLAVRAAAVTVEAPDPAAALAAAEACRALGPDRRREADAWLALSRRLAPRRTGAGPGTTP